MIQKQIAFILFLQSIYLLLNILIHMDKNNIGITNTYTKDILHNI